MFHGAHLIILPQKRARNRDIFLTRDKSAEQHQSNVPPLTAVCPPPWGPWGSLYRTGHHPLVPGYTCLQSVPGCTWAVPGCIWAVPGCTWLYWAVLAYTALYLALPSYPGLYLGCTGLYLVILGCTWSYRALLGCTWSYWAVPGPTQQYWVVSGLYRSVPGCSLLTFLPSLSSSQSHSSSSSTLYLRVISMSKSITTLLTFLSRLSSSYGNPTEPGLTRSQCSAATHGGGAVKLPVLLKLVLEDHQHEPLRLLPVLVKPRKTAQQCTGGIGGVACCPWFNTCGEIGLCTPAGAWWFAIGRECGLQRYI